MATFSAGGLTTAGSTTLPIAALVGGTTTRIHLKEIGVSNTADVAVALKLVRLSTAGTPGATLTSEKVSDPEGPSSIGLLKNTYTVTATMTDLGYRCQLGATKGSGWIWTFPGDRGLVVPAVANAAVGIVVENGTGQACQVYFMWDE